MARVNNLTDFLTDVATAIKTKKGTEVSIPASDFDTEILSIETKGTYQQKTVTIQTNGTQTITPDTGYDAIDEIEIITMIPETPLQVKNYTFTDNVTLELTPDTGYDGFSKIGLTINVAGSEDLDTELAAQDQVIATQQTQINTLLDALVNKSKSPASLNLFVQEDEPESKEGIWIQTIGNIEHIEFDTNIVGKETWDKTTQYASYSYGSNIGLACVGDYLYIIQGNNYAYKYDIKNNTISSITNCPIDFISGQCTAVGTNVYVFNSSKTTDTTAQVYKYDTLTNAWTKLPNAAKNVGMSAVIPKGTTIYLVGGEYDSGIATYDTLTNTSVKTSFSAHGARYCTGCIIGDYLYTFGGKKNNTTALNTVYKQSLINGTYELVTTIPDSTMQSGNAVAWNNYIYITGGTYNGVKTFKYDTLTNTWEQLSNAPAAYGPANALWHNKWFFNGNSKLACMELELEEYDPKTVIVSQLGSLHNTQLYSNTSQTKSRVLFNFYDAWYNDLNKEIQYDAPTYYGDGTQWIKFKN